jgi:transcriptional antiterminator RfaH
MTNLRWYVAQTLARKEALASRNLDQQAFPNFYPRFWTTRNHARKRVAILAPLFPGYLFVRFDPASHPWRSINGTLGVRQLVSSGQTQPLPMPELAMERILARCVDGVVTPMVDAFKAGDVVRIATGPFADHLATIERYNGRERVRILLDFLGASQVADVPVDCLASG